MCFKRLRFRKKMDVTRMETPLENSALRNLALAQSLKWGKEFAVLSEANLARRCNLPAREIERLSEFIQTVQTNILAEIYEASYDVHTQCFTIDTMAAVSEKYPWIDNANLRSLESQGRYYAWHG